MKAIHAVGAVLALIVLSGVLAAQSPESVPPSENPAPSTLATSVSPCTEEQSSIDVLDDAGVPLGGYLQRMKMTVRENWFRLMPETDLDRAGCLAITFVLHKDGQVTDLKIERTSGDEALDRAAWKSIEHSNFFPTMPGRFAGDQLAFRFNFVYNPDRNLRAVQNAKLPPTVISTSTDGPVYGIGHGVTQPRMVYAPTPEYSDKGRQKKIQGTVTMQIVITPSGTVRDAKVITSLEPSLDKQAVLAVNAWKFEPAEKDGVPVAVQITVQVQFHLY